MTSGGFEPAIPVTKRLQAHTLDCKAKSIGAKQYYLKKTKLDTFTTIPYDMANLPEFLNRISSHRWLFLTTCLQNRARTPTISYNTLNFIRHTDEYKTD